MSDLVGQYVRVSSDIHINRFGLLQFNPYNQYRTIYTGSDVNKELNGKLVKPSNQQYPYIIHFYNYKGKEICRVGVKETDFERLPRDSEYRLILEGQHYTDNTTIYHILPNVPGLIEVWFIGYSYYQWLSRITIYFMYPNRDELIITQTEDEGRYLNFYYDPSIHPPVMRISLNLIRDYRIGFQPKVGDKK